MNRRRARAHAFALIYQLPFHEIKDAASIYKNYMEGQEVAHDDYILAAFNGVVERLSEVDKLISDSLQGWQIDRIATVDLAVLRLCVYELKFDDNVPEAVCVNEAVELAKTYGTDDSRAFVNGVLAGIIKQIGGKYAEERVHRPAGGELH